MNSKIFFLCILSGIFMHKGSSMMKEDQNSLGYEQALTHNDLSSILRTYAHDPLRLIPLRGAEEQKKSLDEQEQLDEILKVKAFSVKEHILEMGQKFLNSFGMGHPLGNGSFSQIDSEESKDLIKHINDAAQRLDKSVNQIRIGQETLNGAMEKEIKASEQKEKAGLFTRRIESDLVEGTLAHYLDSDLSDSEKQQSISLNLNCPLAEDRVAELGIPKTANKEEILNAISRTINYVLSSKSSELLAEVKKNEDEAMDLLSVFVRNSIASLQSMYKNAEVKSFLTADSTVYGVFSYMQEKGLIRKYFDCLTKNEENLNIKIEEKINSILDSNEKKDMLTLINLCAMSGYNFDELSEKNMQSISFQTIHENISQPKALHVGNILNTIIGHYDE